MAFGTGKNKEAGCDWDGARAKGIFLFLQAFGFGRSLYNNFHRTALKCA